MFYPTGKPLVWLPIVDVFWCPKADCFKQIAITVENKLEPNLTPLCRGTTGLRFLWLTYGNPMGSNTSGREFAAK